MEEANFREKINAETQISFNTLKKTQDIQVKKITNKNERNIFDNCFAYLTQNTRAQNKERKREKEREWKYSKKQEKNTKNRKNLN